MLMSQQHRLQNAKVSLNDDSTRQENTDAGVRYLYVRINIIKANYKNSITYFQDANTLG